MLTRLLFRVKSIGQSKTSGFSPSATKEILPAFAERPRLQSGDECEKGIRRSFSEGGCASAGSAEDGAGATDFVGGAPPISCSHALSIQGESVIRKNRRGGSQGIEI